MKKKKPRLCNCCGEPIIKQEKKYCSNECQNKQQYLEFIKRWKLGLEKGMKGSQLTSSHIHKYMRITYGNKCIKCGWDKVNPKSGKVPIQLNHKDGDYENNKEENLELLCPNCHSLTENFMNLNKGNGRKERYKKESYN